MHVLACYPTVDIVELEAATTQLCDHISDSTQNKIHWCERFSWKIQYQVFHTVIF